MKTNVFGINKSYLSRKALWRIAIGVSIILLAILISHLPAQKSALADDVLSNNPFAVEVAAGGSHTCAIFNNAGTVYCWGRNEFGQLGTGVSSSVNSPAEIDTISPNPMANLTAKKISAGFNHTCTIAGNLANSTIDAVYCWGQGTNGQLGNGTFANSNEPVAVASPSGLVAKDLAAGFAHTCAIYGPAASNTSNVVYCWGDNDEGQLGNGANGVCSDSAIIDKALCISPATWTDANQPSPVAVNTSGVLSGQSITAISAGTSHSCAVGSAVYCWGGNGSGQLGNDTLTSSNLPVLTSNSTSANQTATGFFYSCMAKTGAIQCWGDDTSGQLGDGNPIVGTDEPSTVIAGLLSGKTAKRVNGGYAHVCTIAGNSADSNLDAVYCWGENGSGQLGNGVASGATVVPNPSPIASTVPPTATSLVAKKVSAGFAHTCAIYGNSSNDLTSVLYCTGDNTDGQLGNASNTQSSVLTPIDMTNITVDESYINVGVDSSDVNISVTPNSAGVLGSAQNELTVVTNNASGYLVQISTDNTQNSLSGNFAIINATNADVNSATPLTGNGWGFAITNSTSGAVTNNFDNDYSNPSLASKWASVPTFNSPKTVISSTSATNATGAKTNFYYAARVNTSIPADNYHTTVTYTVIKQ